MPRAYAMSAFVCIDAVYMCMCALFVHPCHACINIVRIFLACPRLARVLCTHTVHNSVCGYDMCPECALHERLLPRVSYSSNYSNYACSKGM